MNGWADGIAGVFPLVIGVLVFTALWLLTEARWLSRAKSLGRRARQTYLKRFSMIVGPRIADAVGRGRLGARRVRREKQAARRRARCLDELPELMEVLSLGMSAGISFDAALGIYCERYETMLSGMLVDAMRSWQLGLSTRSAALRACGDELGVDSFDRFVDTVAESLGFGAPLASVLASQAEAVRRERRVAVEEQIEKAPVKMVVPTAGLILPAMLLAVVGPIVASMGELV